MTFITDYRAADLAVVMSRAELYYTYFCIPTACKISGRFK